MNRVLKMTEGEAEVVLRPLNYVPWIDSTRTNLIVREEEVCDTARAAAWLALRTGKTLYFDFGGESVKWAKWASPILSAHRIMHHGQQSVHLRALATAGARRYCGMGLPLCGIIIDDQQNGDTCTKQAS